MRIAKRLGLVLLTVCALTALAVSSASAAPKFLSHPLGLLLGSTGGSNQIFTTAAGAVECSALKLLPPDTTVALESAHILVVVDYEKCKIFGIINAVIHPVQYLINANGNVTVENLLLLLAEQKCVVKVAAGQTVGKVAFKNNANGTMLLEANVTSIKSEGSGGPLNACEFAAESKGTYTGNTFVKLDSNPPGGVIRWDPA